MAAGEPVGFDDHDGDFSAKIALTHLKDLKEYDKPSDLGVRLNVLSKVKPGQPVAIHVLFMGMALDANQSCDVTYDVKLLDPDGKVSGGIDEKNIVALREVIQNRELVFNNKEFRAIGFEESDKAGTYKVVTVVYDNIGKKKVPVTAEIQLIK